MTGGPLFQEKTPLVRRPLFGRRRLIAIFAITVLLAACGALIGGRVLNSNRQPSVQGPSADGSTRLSPGELRRENGPSSTGIPEGDGLLPRVVSTIGDLAGESVDALADAVQSGVETAANTIENRAGDIIRATRDTGTKAVRSIVGSSSSNMDVSAPQISATTTGVSAGDPDPAVDEGAQRPGSMGTGEQEIGPSAEEETGATTTDEEQAGDERQRAHSRDSAEEEPTSDPSGSPSPEPSESPSESPSQSPSESPSPSPSPSP